MISPIGAVGSDTHTKALLALEYIIKKALPEEEFEIRRADFEHAPDSITQLVVKRIIEADLIVADLTGHNPNVFYELAIAHSFKRPVVIITTEGTPAPFDITDQRYISYNLANPASIYASQERLLDSARYALAHPEELHTPVSEYAKALDRTSRAVSGDQDALVELFEGLQERLSGIEGSVRSMRVESRNRRLVYTPTGDSSGGTTQEVVRRLANGSIIPSGMTAREWKAAQEAVYRDQHLSRLAEERDNPDQHAADRATIEREKEEAMMNRQGDENDV
ncbi:hypothetical protein [Rhodococcus sp. Leaf278]|uniref:hypothetical protein n=1 Tax=Rhodococcus sp. Leaf278 TaxID=1736319 RepID=UPI000B2E2E5C|nr:hypothetical protein [Rhodococcus sp. Leaf278]